MMTAALASKKPCGSCCLRQLIPLASLVGIHPVWGMKKYWFEKKGKRIQFVTYWKVNFPKFSIFKI